MGQRREECVGAGLGRVMLKDGELLLMQGILGAWANTPWTKLQKVQRHSSLFVCLFSLFFIKGPDQLLLIGPFSLLSLEDLSCHLPLPRTMARDYFAFKSHSTLTTF